MADLNFPLNPNVGDSYTVGSRTWIWTGSAWQLQSAVQNLDPFTVKTLVVTSTTNSTGTATGSVVIAGGVGLAGDLRVGGTIYGNIDATVNTTTNISNGALGSIPYQVSPGITRFIDIGSTGSLLQSNGTTATWISTSNIYVGYSNNSNNSNFASSSSYSDRANLVDVVNQTQNASFFLTFVNSNNSTENPEKVYTTSSVVVNPNFGGIGLNTSSPTAILDVNGGVKISGITTITNITSASSTNTGALVVAGGVGIGGDLWVGGTFYAGGQLVLTTASFGANINEGADIHITTTGTSTIIISNTSTLQSVTSRGATTTNIIYLASSAASTSTNSGALQVAGGVGIGGDLHVGGLINVQKTVSSPPTLTVDTTSIPIDSFAITQYRSAKYFISISNTVTNQFQTSEIWLVQDGTSANIEQTSVFSSGTNYVVSFSTDISSGIVSLIATGINPSNRIKAQITYITV